MSTETLHLAIIPDGNRRWAKQQALKPWQGHERALENSRQLLEWCYTEPRVGILTLWGFSTENWNRSQAEIDKLMQLIEKFLADERPRFHEKQARLVHSGRLDRLPGSLRKLIETITAETNSYTAFTFNLALDYGGKDEIIRALARADGKTIATEADLRAYLDHPELADIDIIVRTSGEQRTSNFFLWQAAYAEWFFIPLLYPELKPAHLAKILEEYDQRQRRFGR